MIGSKIQTPNVRIAGKHADHHHGPNGRSINGGFIWPGD